MLTFHSGSVRAADPRRAIAECLDSAFGGADPDCDLVIINASVGHDLKGLLAETAARCPRARIVLASCAGVVGREGVSESTRDVAVMAVRGPDLAVAHADDITGDSSYAKAREVATALKAAKPRTNMVYVLAPGIDIANDQVIAGFESVLGPEVTLFGATSSDNMKGIHSFQAIDQTVTEHTLFAVGFGDATLEVDTQATHGFLASGAPMTVTEASGNRIERLDGEPAWSRYTDRLGLPDSSTPGDTIPIGALAEALPEAVAAEYGNSHILRVVTHCTPTGGLVYATDCAPGTTLWLTTRDEDLIFKEMERMLASMAARARGRKPVAVFQADCLARGRRLFNRILKEELVQRMHFAFAQDGDVPPWLGMYGFGEYARLDGRNAYHNYTTALAAIYRKP